MKFINSEDSDSKCYKSEAGLYKRIARTYWDRWQWELQKRKLPASAQQPTKLFQLHKIDPNDLNDPVIDGNAKEMYIGRGSFSVVRLQQYRGMKVAVNRLYARYALRRMRVHVAKREIRTP